jgi:hypothetical protein
MKQRRLVKRFEMRCTASDYRRWERCTKQLGLPSVATFMRLAANEVSSRKLDEEIR